MVCNPPPVTKAVLVSVPAETTVTVPLPDGDAHVPSPRQYVEDDALVPLFRLVTGRLPVTPVVSGSPVAFVRVPDVGVPSTGVTNVGEVANTRAPVPVSFVTAEIRFALVGVPRKVATPDPSPDTPVDTGSPVAFVSVPAEGVPRSGVVSTGDDNAGAVAKTNAPVPVSLVTAEIKFALVGVPRKVATPVPSPETPVLMGMDGSRASATVPVVTAAPSMTDPIGSHATSPVEY